MLAALYNDPRGPTPSGWWPGWWCATARSPRVREDLHRLLISVSALLQDDVCAAPAARITRFGSHERTLPVLSEIALTYRCQNRCTFCYADAPRRGADVPEMTTDEVQRIIDRIADEAHCPTLSFTGGEPVARGPPELIAYGGTRACG